MKTIRFLALALSALLLVSCFGGKEETPEAAEVGPKPEQDSRPDRPPPPPQPQDGSMIVRPGGTAADGRAVASAEAEAALKEAGVEDAGSAVCEAEAEIRKRKAEAADSDDPVSRALNSISECNGYLF